MASCIETVASENAPPPAGPYSQGVRAGDFVFLAGQTARTAAGPLPETAPRAEHCRQALENLAAVAAASGGTLNQAVKVNVYLADLSWKPDFDAVYAELVGSKPARSTVCAAPPTGMVEVDAVLYLATYRAEV